MLPWIFIHGYLRIRGLGQFRLRKLQCCHGFSSMDTLPCPLPSGRTCACFNVAMDFHPWIHRVKRKSTVSLTCFNVAMDFHPWILIPTDFSASTVSPASMLPWIFIHGYVVVSYIVAWVACASMLPWIFIHGYS